MQIGAPPLLVYWLGGQNDAVTVRANIMVYFIMQGALSIVGYFCGALFTPQTLALSLLLGIPFGVLMVVGARWFHGSSDELYRRVAYVIIGVGGIDQPADFRCAALILLFAHDLFRKPVLTFRDHALKALRTHLLHQRVRHLEIGVDVLHVVAFVERLDQLQELLAGLVVDRDRVLRLPQ